MTTLSFQVTTKLPLASATRFWLVRVPLAPPDRAGRNWLPTVAPLPLKSCAAAFEPSSHAIATSPLASPAIDNPAAPDGLETLNLEPFRAMGRMMGMAKSLSKKNRAKQK